MLCVDGQGRGQGRDILGGSNIENAVTEGAKGDGGVPGVTRVAERHFQDCDVVDDRCRDSCDEKEDSRRE